MLKLRSIFLLICLISSFNGFGQNNSLILDGAIMTIWNNAVLTIDNSNANGIVRLSTGHIVTEAENNIIQWNIANNTGNYLIPFGDENGDYIPVNYNITSSAVGPGFLRASTYSTAPNNTPWPAGVTHLNNNNTNAPNGANTNDRFWVLDASSYSQPPAVTMNMTYRDAEHIAPNTIVELELRAQRFNDVLDLWGDWRPPGQTINTGTNTVGNIVVPSSQYFNVWALAGYSNPLPVELAEFRGDCINNSVHLNWITLSEIQNDFFEIQRSNDGLNYNSIATVDAIGTSNRMETYNFVDHISSKDQVYYRLLQHDINGDKKILKTIRVDPCDRSLTDQFEIISLDQSSIVVHAIVLNKGNYSFKIMDALGKIVYEDQQYLQAGSEIVTINSGYLSQGMYLFNVLGTRYAYTEKIQINNR